MTSLKSSNQVHWLNFVPCAPSAAPHSDRPSLPAPNVSLICISYMTYSRPPRVPSISPTSFSALKRTTIVPSGGSPSSALSPKRCSTKIPSPAPLPIPLTSSNAPHENYFLVGGRAGFTLAGSPRPVGPQTPAQIRPVGPGSVVRAQAQNHHQRAGMARSTTGGLECRLPPLLPSSLGGPGSLHAGVDSSPRPLQLWLATGLFRPG